MRGAKRVLMCSVTQLLPRSTSQDRIFGGIIVKFSRYKRNIDLYVVVSCAKWI